MNLSSTWGELVVNNPMLIEITRFRRKFFTINANGGLAMAILFLIAMCYGGMVLLVIKYGHDIEPIYLVVAQTVLFTLIAPMLAYSAIAGERERRSWDLLLVAPISKAQIVIGKFIGALSAVAAGVGAFLVPIVITLCDQPRPSAGLGYLVEAELLSVSFVIAVCALTLFFSGRVKRSFMALGATFGILAVFLVIIPSLLASIIGVGGPMNAPLMEFATYLHPFSALARLVEAVQTTRPSQSAIPISMFGIPQTLVYLFLTIVILSWTIQTLHFAENEVKFIPRAKT